MLSGVLKQASERLPGKRYRLARRTGYQEFLRGHPAIEEIGFPPKDAEFARADYWSMEDLGPGPQRPYQILARGFGLETPVEETLFIPDDHRVEDPILHQFLPWEAVNVLIAPSSDSPRKVMPPDIWHVLVEMLLDDDAFVFQVGRARDQRIRNAYSLLGLTTPRQAIELVRRSSVVITADSFIMHVAHHTRTPAVVVWGPTSSHVYGYPEHMHLQLPKRCDLGEYEDCIGPGRNEGGRLYGTACPLGENHCLRHARPEELHLLVKRALVAGGDG